MHKKRAALLRGRRSSVVLPGFEPGQTEPKPVVLPLHHKTVCASRRGNIPSALASAKVVIFLHIAKNLFNFRLKSLKMAT